MQCSARTSSSAGSYRTKSLRSWRCIISRGAPLPIGRKPGASAWRLLRLADDIEFQIRKNRELDEAVRGARCCATARPSTLSSRSDVLRAMWPKFVASHCDEALQKISGVKRRALNSGKLDEAQAGPRPHPLPRNDENTAAFVIKFTRLPAPPRPARPSTGSGLQAAPARSRIQRNAAAQARDRERRRNSGAPSSTPSAHFRPARNSAMLISRG